MIPPDTQPPERMQINRIHWDHNYTKPLDDLWPNRTAFLNLKLSFYQNPHTSTLLYFTKTFGPSRQTIKNPHQTDAFVWSFSSPMVGQTGTAFAQTFKMHSIIFAIIKPTMVHWEYDRRSSVLAVVTMFPEIIHQLRCVVLP